jgi:hypothetical protein
MPVSSDESCCLNCFGCFSVASLTSSIFSLIFAIVLREAAMSKATICLNALSVTGIVIGVMAVVPSSLISLSF